MQQFKQSDPKNTGKVMTGDAISILSTIFSVNAEEEFADYLTEMDPNKTGKIDYSKLTAKIFEGK